MLSQKNKNFALILVGLFLVVVIWALSVNKPIAPYLTKQPNSSGSTMPTIIPASPPNKAVVIVPKYEDVVKEFGGRRIQFDAMCQAIPNSFTVKSGTQVMFDNRSGDARWFTLNGFGYHLNGYSFTTVTLSSKKLPLNVVIDCGSAQNVAQILLQK